MNWPSDVSVLRTIANIGGHVHVAVLINWARRHYVGETVAKRTIEEHMSRSLQRLESDGLVTRRRSANDRRVWEYYAN